MFLYEIMQMLLHLYMYAFLSVHVFIVICFHVYMCKRVLIKTYKHVYV